MVGYFKLEIFELKGVPFDRKKLRRSTNSQRKAAHCRGLCMRGKEDLVLAGSERKVDALGPSVGPGLERGDQREAQKISDGC